ncbi:MAG: zinc-dependent metalloprotease, partial [Bacteroidota bacterium]|nr:zinc-dependent metalloprotease [Bacteroidota bacterium]
MRISVSLFVSLMLTSLLGLGQKPVVSATQAYFKSQPPQSYIPFSPAESRNDFSAYVKDEISLAVNEQFFQQVRRTSPATIQLQLPASLGVTLDLYRSTIYSSGAQIITSSGEKRIPDPRHLFYRGMIHGNSNSIAIVSIFRDEINILYADEFGNRRIQKTHDGTYIAIEDKNILIPKSVGCFVEDNHALQDSVLPNSNRVFSGNCVEVYVEADFKSYQDNGSSVAQTEAWIAALWNEVITLYANENIPVLVSSSFVYTSTDPFAGLSTTQTILNAFGSHIDTLTYNGRLAHFMSTRSLGGGIAWLNVLCSTTNPVAVSTSLNTNIQSFPTYSWNVEVVTHEMGHNMGSPHTHNCSWNGNNTAIDGCGPAAGYSEGCNAPLPPSGTIMSYCHLVSGVGINFNNGFGQQPGDLIRLRYTNAACNTGTCQPPVCTSLTQPVPDATNVDINQNLSWSPVAGANGYRISIGTTSGGTEIVNNLDVGLVTNYDPVNTFLFNTLYYIT